MTPGSALGASKRRALAELFGYGRRPWRVVLRLKLTLVDRKRYERTVLETIDGLTLVVPPDVFNPKLLRSGEFLVQQLERPDALPPGARVLDLGCGSGASGIAAARRGCQVTASDISCSAVRCTRINALLNNVELDIRQGDLFAPLNDEQFDVILFNPPYYRGAPRDALDGAWRSFDVLERFARALAARLTPGGHALLVLSSDGEGDSLLRTLDQHGFRCEVVGERDFVNEVMRVHRVSQC